MKKLLYINASMNKENSRTDRLARAWISKRLSSGNYQLQTVDLAGEKNLFPLLWTNLQNRLEAIEQKDFSTP